MKSRLLALAAAAVFAFGVQAVLAAPIHNESGDAGGTIAGAQVVDGDGPPGSPVTAIVGSLSGGNDVDIYGINISSPAVFSASTQGGAAFDTQLFLFHGNGVGISANDDTAASLQSLLPAGNPLHTVLAPGSYFLAITGFDNDPLDGAANLIFQSSPFIGVYGPNPGVGPLAGFSGGGSSGQYTIFLTGVTHTPGPASVIGEPASVIGWTLIAGIGSVGAYLRRRRKSA